MAARLDSKLQSTFLSFSMDGLRPVACRTESSGVSRSDGRFVFRLLAAEQNSTSCPQCWRQSDVVRALSFINWFATTAYVSRYWNQNKRHCTRDSVVDIATRHGLDGPGIKSWQDQEIFLLQNRPHLLRSPPRG